MGIFLEREILLDKTEVVKDISENKVVEGTKAENARLLEKEPSKNNVSKKKKSTKKKTATKRAPVKKASNTVPRGATAVESKTKTPVKQFTQKLGLLIPLQIRIPECVEEVRVKNLGIGDVDVALGEGYFETLSMGEVKVSKVSEGCLLRFLASCRPVVEVQYF